MECRNDRSPRERLERKKGRGGGAGERASERASSRVESHRVPEREEGEGGEGEDVTRGYVATASQ